MKGNFPEFSVWFAGAQLGQLVNWWAGPGYRVQQYINWADSSSVSPRIISASLEILMRRLNPDLTSSLSAPHVGATQPGVQLSLQQ